MTAIEIISALLYQQSAYEIAQRLVFTGAIACVPCWIFGGCKDEKAPWATAYGAFAHALLFLGFLCIAWTVPV